MSRDLGVTNYTGTVAPYIQVKLDQLGRRRNPVGGVTVQQCCGGRSYDPTLAGTSPIRLRFIIPYSFFGGCYDSINP
jgi:hypothetical protein